MKPNGRSKSSISHEVDIKMRNCKEILIDQTFIFYILLGNGVEKYIPDDKFGVRCTNVITQLRLKFNGCNSLFYLQDLKRAHQCNNSGRAYPS